MADYVKLGDDLDRIIADYDDNSLITAVQRETWFKEGKRKAVTHGMLGQDHPKALRLDNPGGHGGETVGSLRSNTARRFWDYGEGHVFPPREDLLRFGLFMHLDLYRVLALILKGDWEYHFSYGMRSWRPNRGVQILDVILDAEDTRSERRCFDSNRIPERCSVFSRSSCPWPVPKGMRNDPLIPLCRR